MAEAGLLASSNSMRRHPRNEFQRQQPTRASGRLARFLVLPWVLATVVTIAVFVPSARAQSSVTLAWDASPGGAIAGYRLYDGAASRTYTNTVDVGNATTGTLSNLVSGATYFFAVTAYDTNGLESDYSSEVSYTVPLPSNPPPAIALTSPVNGMVYSEPATISLSASVSANGHAVSQVQFYNGGALVGTVSAAPYDFTWKNVSAGTYSLSAKLAYDSGSTVASTAVNVTVAAGKPGTGLSFAANSGDFTAPFVDNNGTLSQPTETDVTNGGEATYSFSLNKAGKYLVSAEVIAPDDGQNSLYVNIDAEPTDPLMIWDIPLCSTLTSQVVSWRGNGTSDPPGSQYNPKVFSLSAGTHQLIIRGREANTTLGTITISAVPPKLKIKVANGPGILGLEVGSGQISVLLDITGDPGETYNVLSSQDFQTWTPIGTVTIDASGSGQFTNSVGSSIGKSYYRLHAP